jgi:hypothetical protein
MERGFGQRLRILARSEEPDSAEDSGDAQQQARQPEQRAVRQLPLIRHQ